MNFFLESHSLFNIPPARTQFVLLANQTDFSVVPNVNDRSTIRVGVDRFFRKTCCNSGCFGGHFVGDLFVHSHSYNIHFLIQILTGLRTTAYLNNVWSSPQLNLWGLRMDGKGRIFKKKRNSD